MKALLVDDSKVVRSVSGGIMDELGIDHDEAENGLVALDKVSKENYDFILLDWNMPEMDGIDFFRKAKEKDLIKDTKVIFCTTENEIEKISIALEEGASEYVMKPFDRNIIEDKLRYLEII
jgi:two-component system chemotaxis response regulator CheY